MCTEDTGNTKVLSENNLQYFFTFDTISSVFIQNAFRNNVDPSVRFVQSESNLALMKADLEEFCNPDKCWESPNPH